MRMSVALITAGAVAVLIALVVLWRSTQTMAAEPIAVTTESSSAVPRSTSPSSSATAAARTQPSTPPAPGEAPAPPAQDFSDRRFSLDNPHNLHFGGAQLREQTAAVDGLVRQCVANAASQKLTGNVVLTFIVAKRGDKYLVEDTGIDHEKTSLQNESLLECLHKTALSMKFIGLPRDAEALTVTRSVKLDNGALTEHKMTGFSYIH